MNGNERGTREINILLERTQNEHEDAKINIIWCQHKTADTSLNTLSTLRLCTQQNTTIITIWGSISAIRKRGVEDPKGWVCLSKKPTVVERSSTAPSTTIDEKERNALCARGSLSKTGAILQYKPPLKQTVLKQMFTHRVHWSLIENW